MALSFMRRHRRWLYVFLWLVIAAFIILYIPTLGQDEGAPGEAVAVVGGLNVSVAEFQRSYYRQRQVYDRLYPGRLDEATLRQLGLEEQVLDALVVDRLVELEARRLGLTVSDEALARAITTAPEFQDNGQFIGSAEIRRRLELQGLSEEEFAHSLRRQLLRGRLESLVTAGVSVSEEEAEREFRRRSEQVRLEYVQVDAERFRSSITPSEDEIRARFEAKKESYRIPEKRVVSYVLLDRERLRPQVTVTDRDLEQYYQDNRDQFRQEEQACASHILVKVREGETGEGHPEAEARRIALDLLAQVKGGAEFGALARSSSEDQGSSANGGDLGCFAPGRMVPAFDGAVFAMEPGQVSDLVRSPFGYHIIRLASRQEESVLPLAQVKERIRQIVTDQKMQDLGNQKAQTLASTLARGTSLEDAARAQGHVVQKSEPFARGEVRPPLSSASLVARAFAMKVSEVAREGFALAQGAVFISLAEVQPAHLPELKDVHDRVRADLVLETASAKARELAEGVRLRAEALGLEKAAVAAGLVRKETPALTSRSQPLGDLGTGAVLEDAAFSLAEGTFSAPVRTGAGWAVLRVLERKPFDPAAFAAQRGQVIAALRQQKQGTLFAAYLADARERYEIQRRADALRRAMGQER